MKQSAYNHYRFLESNIFVSCVTKIETVRCKIFNSSLVIRKTFVCSLENISIFNFSSFTNGWCFCSRYCRKTEWKSTDLAKLL